MQPHCMRVAVEYSGEGAGFQARGSEDRTTLGIKCLRRMPGAGGGDDHPLQDDALIDFSICEALDDPDVRLVDPRQFTASWDPANKLHTLSWAVENKGENSMFQWSTPRRSQRTD